MIPPLISVRHIHKWYAGVHALKGVTLDVQSREVVGLVGDNGAGKSTLIKILSGVLQPDKGEIRIEGQGVEITSPTVAMRFGVETIYQDASMVPTMSIARNLFIGREPLRLGIGRIGLIDHDRMRREAIKAIADVDLHLRSPDATLAELSGGQRQGVAIARDAFQVANSHSRRTDQSPVGQGDGESARLRARPTGARGHGHSH